VEAQRSWGLHRPPSTIRSGTGRLVCQFGDLGTPPATEHCTLRDWSTSLPVWRFGDCTEHRALYARELVDQSASLEICGLHRPPSTIRSGTSRPVCQFGDLGTAPTTEHCTLRDWSTSLPVWRSGDCTDHRALYAGRPVCQFRNLWTAPTTEHYTLGDWSTNLLVWRTRDCTDHQALYAQGLVDKPIRWQTGMICSGTG